MELCSLSSAELSIDISRLVSRARNGEAINTRAEGEALAARYPGLGMSADLISKAIDRAASMMGVVLDGAAEPPGGTADPGHDAEPPPDVVSAALDGQEVAPNVPSPILFASGTPDGAIDEPADPQQGGEVAGAPEVKPETPALARPVAAMRRAFFGA